MKAGLLQFIVAVWAVGACIPSEGAGSDESAAALPKEKTVEVSVKSKADLHAQMVKWNREGWLVLSLSAELPQPDGSVLRRVRLRKAAPDEVVLPFVKYMSVEFIESSEADLAARTNQWERQGWKLGAISARLRQENGIVLRRAELQRSPAPGETVSSAVEYKWVEFVETSKASMQEHLTQANNEGWRILSMSAPAPQTNGTVVRYMRLSRPKEP